MWQELQNKPGAPEPSLLRQLRNVAFEPAPDDCATLPARLYPAERDAIALAVHHGNASVILDDASARRMAAQRGLHVVGTVGILVEAKRRGLIETIGAALDGLIRHGFRLSPDIARAALVAAGEAKPGA